MGPIARRLPHLLAIAAAIFVLLIVGLVATGHGDWSDVLRALFIVAITGGLVGSWLQFATRRPTGASTEPVQELEMIPAVRDVVLAKRRTMRRTFLVLGLGMPAILVAIGAGVAVFSGDTIAISLLSVFAALLALFLLALWWFADRPFAKDLQETTYLRDSGPLEVLGGRSQYRLYIGDRWLPIDAFIRDQLPALARGTVEYTRHTRTLLELRDEHGNIRYRDKAYRPADALASGPGSHATVSAEKKRRDDADYAC